MRRAEEWARYVQVWIDLGENILGLLERAAFVARQFIPLLLFALAIVGLTLRALGLVSYELPFEWWMPIR